MLRNLFGNKKNNENGKNEIPENLPKEIKEMLELLDLPIPKSTEEMHERIESMFDKFTDFNKMIGRGEEVHVINLTESLVNLTKPLSDNAIIIQPFIEGRSPALLHSPNFLPRKMDTEEIMTRLLPSFYRISGGFEKVHFIFDDNIHPALKAFLGSNSIIKYKASEYKDNVIIKCDKDESLSYEAKFAEDDWNKDDYLFINFTGTTLDPKYKPLPLIHDCEDVIEKPLMEIAESILTGSRRDIDNATVYFRMVYEHIRDYKGDKKIGLVYTPNIFDLIPQLKFFAVDFPELDVFFASKFTPTDRSMTDLVNRRIETENITSAASDKIFVRNLSGKLLTKELRSMVDDVSGVLKKDELLLNAIDANVNSKEFNMFNFLNDEKAVNVFKCCYGLDSRVFIDNPNAVILFRTTTLARVASTILKDVVDPKRFVVPVSIVDGEVELFEPFYLIK